MARKIIFLSTDPEKGEQLTRIIARHYKNLVSRLEIVANPGKALGLLTKHKDAIVIYETMLGTMDSNAARSKLVKPGRDIAPDAWYFNYDRNVLNCQDEGDGHMSAHIVSLDDLAHMLSQIHGTSTLEELKQAFPTLEHRMT